MSAITWDESKRADNFAKHGIDLAELESTCRYADRRQTQVYFAQVQL